jgi:hypothetical protein
MKQLFPLLLFLTAVASCNKEPSQQSKKETDLASPAFFSFGASYGFCVGDCANFYLIEKQQIFPDDMKILQKPLIFKSTALNNEKYLIAKPLIDSFPAYLINNPDTTFGCPDCYDQGAIYLELKNEEGVKYWNIDMDEKGQPGEIRDYIQQLILVLNQL